MRVKTGVIASLIIVTMLVSLLPATLVRGFIPEPYELYGTARDELGVALPNGSPIRSFVDGVDYSNKTAVFGQGLFDIDTYGNYMTNETSVGTPEIKEGADQNETITYVWGDMSNNTRLDVTKPWLTGIVFKENATWQTGLAPQSGNLNAALAAVQPPLLKIQSIVTNSTIIPYTDYVYVCNPTPNPVDASKFYLQKDIPGDVNGPIVQLPSKTISPKSTLYVDLNTTNYFVETGDNLKLVWENTPGAGAANAGNDIIIDRVEFNKTGTGGTLYWEPGNTIQNDELAPARGTAIFRSTSCVSGSYDTNSAVQDFQQNTEPGRPNNQPNPPYPISLQGISSDNQLHQLRHITVLSSFPMTWDFTDPDIGDVQSKADVKITDDDNKPLPVDIWFKSVPGAGESVSYDGMPLLKCRNFTLSIRTWDATQNSSWATMDFHTNCDPGGLVQLTPTNGATVAPGTTQTVTWQAATDVDPGDIINYTWSVDIVPLPAGGVSTGQTTTTSSNQFTTNPITNYYWKVSMSDGWIPTPIETTVWLFITSQGEQPPQVDQLTVDGHLAGDAYLTHATNRLAPVLGWHFSKTGDTQTKWAVEVRNTTAVVWTTSGTGTTSSVVYAGPALESGMDYTYRANVTDSHDLYSGWSTPLNFHINTPPPVPTPSAPTNGGTVTAGSTTTVQWTSGGADAESDTVTYEYCVATTDPPTGCGTAAGNNITGTQSNAFTTVSGTKYYWFVKAWDAHEPSAWSAVWNFTATGGVVNTPPTITISYPVGGEVFNQGDSITITWTVLDTQDTAANLIVWINYTYGTQRFSIVGPISGSTTQRQWTIPSIVRNDVRINATVMDTGGLKGYSQSGQFQIQEKPKEAPMDWTVIIIAVIIIIVVVMLVLFLLMKRKKPKAEEEEGAPPPAEEGAEEAPAEEEEEVVEEEIVEEEEAPAPPPKPAPKPAAPVAARPPAKPAAKTKECPSCGTIVSVTDKECFMCGAKV